MLENPMENNPEPVISNNPPLSPTPPPVQEMPVVTTPSVSQNTNSGSSKKGLILTSILALVAISVLGVLAFSISKQPQEEKEPSQTAVPTVTKIQTLALDLGTLTDGTIANTKSLKVSGNTGVKATLTIVGGADDVIVETSGNFTVDVPLNDGENKLIFTAQDSQENQVTASRSIFYTEEQL